MTFTATPTTKIINFKKFGYENIEAKNQDQLKIEKVSSFQRALAILIDVWVVIFIRFFFLALLGEIWMNDEIIQFKKEYDMAFGENQSSTKPTEKQITFC